MSHTNNEYNANLFIYMTNKQVSLTVQNHPCNALVSTLVSLSSIKMVTFGSKKRKREKPQTVKVKALKWDCTQRMGGVMAVSSIFSYPICLFVK